MNPEPNQTSTDVHPEIDRTPQYDQPESGYRTEEEEELRQSSPLNPRVAEKSEEAMEEA